MKIRTDYVSNSSSSSFIIDFADKGACIDKHFMALLKRFRSVTVHGNCESKGQCDELKGRARVLFGEKCVGDWINDDNCIWLELDDDDIDDASDAQIALIREVLALNDSNMNCNGGDDFGDEAARAIQIATLLEAKYKSIEISGEDHCDYTTIRGTSLDF